MSTPMSGKGWDFLMLPVNIQIMTKYIERMRHEYTQGTLLRLIVLQVGRERIAVAS